MNNLTLNKPQIQVILDNLTKQEGGTNSLLELTLNAFMKAERNEFVQSNKSNKGNGFRKINALGITEGLNLSLPRDRLGHFKPFILEVMREQQSSMEDLIFELYAKGLSTRDLADVSEMIYGKYLSKSSISRITETFYEEMHDYLNRKIDRYYPAIYLDATYIKTKRETVSSEAYYVILGVKTDCTREVIGIYNAPTESASVWQDIFLDLKDRGLRETKLFIIDNLSGLDSAIEKHFPAQIQKCVLHLKRHILQRVKKQHREILAFDLADIFQIDKTDDSLQEALSRAKACSSKWSKLYPFLKLLSNKRQMIYYFEYLNYDYRIRSMIYTTNWIERLNKDFKRVIKIRNSMPNVDSVLTLLAKVSMSLNNSRYTYPVHRLRNEMIFNQEIVD